MDLEKVLNLLNEQKRILDKRHQAQLDLKQKEIDSLKDENKKLRHIIDLYHIFSQ